MREERKQRIRQRVNESPEAQRIARLLEVFKNADDEHRRQMEPELRDAEDDAAEAAERIEREEHESSRERIRALMRESIEAKEGAKQAKESAERLAVQIREDDAPGEELIAPGVMRRVVASIVEAVRSTLTASDLPSAVAETPVPPPAAAMSARKYMPYDRSFDRVERVEGTPEAHRQYEEARRECAQVIQATTERLKRLRPPARPTVRVNADAGRLDPRKAVKVGLAVRGAPVDVSRVWKETIERPEPRFAVSLLLDCSGSMHGKKFTLARNAACCLSEVLTGLQIPHEIIGHTTSDDVGPVMEALAENKETPENYSRLVPFLGYVFKEFTEKAAPTNVFSGIDMDANLDGEGVLWALERLALRKEKTKLLIVLCDGLPAAPMSRIDELERALYTVCKQAESREREGLHLCAIGINTERVKEFYRNAVVLNDVTDLPQAVLRIVEHVMLATEKRR